MVDMLGQKTLIHNEEKGKSHDFNYDESFWSFEASDPRFATQEIVYSKIGRPLVDRTMEGYNCCMFAYGQVCCTRQAHRADGIRQILQYDGIYERPWSDPSLLSGSVLFHDVACNGVVWCGEISHCRARSRRKLATLKFTRKTFMIS